ncbi:GGDEF domain-containing protein [Catenulispora rubra]|uniref:GGDEF domain-containing protein n=1 Tax=Catenulispora rubra TaxID=280293 RepID=UPI0018921741|nr:GGDEF domain-containing protein [Catenulispora rubra]
MSAAAMLVPTSATAALGVLNLAQRRQVVASRRDPVTGLATRAAWCRLAAKAVRRPAGLWLLAVDGDGFKAINDTFGHDAGDAVIAALAARLAAWVGPRGTAGRLGGDEFMAFCRPHRTDAPLGVRMADLLAALSAPVRLGATVLPAAASVGVVEVAALPTPTLPQAMKGADVALYAAKHGGRGTWRLAEPPAGGYTIQSAPLRRTRTVGAAGQIGGA